MRPWRLPAAAALAAIPSLAHAAAIRGAAAPDLHLIRIGAAVLLGSFIVVVAALLLKRFGAAQRSPGAPFIWLRRSGPAVSVLECRRLSAHADVCRLAHDGCEYLVVVSAGGATVLREKQAEEAQADL